MLLAKLLKSYLYARMVLVLDLVLIFLLVLRGDAKGANPGVSRTVPDKPGQTGRRAMNCDGRWKTA
jgi:hypothetical protein